MTEIVRLFSFLPGNEWEELLELETSSTWLNYGAPGTPSGQMYK